MKKMPESIVFFGSGPVAAQALELLNRDFNIESVVTKPKPAHHRGEFPVITLAKKLGLKTYEPANRQQLSEFFTTKPATSKIGVLIDYGIIVSQDVIDYFPLGIVNSHFSLLPEWRGADPITFSILSGQPETGVSLMLLVEAMDEGPLLAQAPYKLRPGITTPELTEDLVEISHEALCSILPLYASGKTDPAPQLAVTIAPSKVPSYSRKLTKEDGIVDWSKPAEQIEHEIRAFNGWPKSRAKLAGKDVIITRARVLDETGQAGKVSASKDRLIVHCGQGSLLVERLKPAGKREMTAGEFLAGNPIG